MTEAPLPNCGTPQLRRETQRHARREAILDLAEASFLERGYAGTTMSAIAAMLGGSKATLWRYFSSKELLFAAALDRATSEFHTGLEAILEKCNEVVPTLCDFCEGYLLRATSPQAIALQRVVIGEAGRFPEVGKIFYERGPRKTINLLAEYLQRSMTDGLLRQEDPAEVARMLIGRCMVGVQQPLLMRAIDDVKLEVIRLNVQDAVKILLRSLSTVPS